MKHWLKANSQGQLVYDITPETAGWRYLSFQLINLKAGEFYRQPTGKQEMALVPLAGRARLRAATLTCDVSRRGVFEELPHVLYVPPGNSFEVEALTDFEFSIGGAPAEGKYPIRLFT